LAKFESNIIGAFKPIFNRQVSVKYLSPFIPGHLQKVHLGFPSLQESKTHPRKNLRQDSDCLGKFDSVGESGHGVIVADETLNNIMQQKGLLFLLKEDHLDLLEDSLMIFDLLKDFLFFHVFCCLKFG
jgi:hypothetical protein